MLRRLLCLSVILLTAVAVGCNGGDDGDEQPSVSIVTATATVGRTETPVALPATSTATQTAGTAAPTATRTATATAVSGTATPTPRPASATATIPAATPTPGRVDGTVAPQNAGSTDPVTVKANPDPFQGTAILRDVRIGLHPEEGGWERIVFEFGAELPPGSIRYVDTATACGSGERVTVRGGAILLVRFDQAVAHNEAGQSTVARRELTGPGNTILEAKTVCDFEADVTWAVGVKAQQRFKVTLLDAPRRVVIDIKQ